MNKLKLIKYQHTLSFILIPIYDNIIFNSYFSNNIYRYTYANTRPRRNSIEGILAKQILFEIADTIITPHPHINNLL